MIGTTSFEIGNMALNNLVQDGYVMTSVAGSEVYSLVDKESGRVTLAAFESKVAANRFFAGNNSYYATKIM
jgi:hypothetical protein